MQSGYPHFHSACCCQDHPTGLSLWPGQSFLWVPPLLPPLYHIKSFQGSSQFHVIPPCLSLSMKHSHFQLAANASFHHSLLKSSKTVLLFVSHAASCTWDRLPLNTCKVTWFSSQNSLFVMKQNAQNPGDSQAIHVQKPLPIMLLNTVSVIFSTSLTSHPDLSLAYFTLTTSSLGHGQSFYFALYSDLGSYVLR